MKTRGLFLIFLLSVSLPFSLSGSYKLNKETSTNEDKNLKKEGRKYDIKPDSYGETEESSTTTEQSNIIITEESDSVTTEELDSATTEESVASESNYPDEKQDITNALYMDDDKKYFVKWKINATHIVFEVEVETLGWVGLGLAPTGGMPNADIAVMWIVKGKLTLQDRFARGFFEPDIDTQQDWIPLYSHENKTHTIVRFARLLDTCDEMDRKITKDTVHLLYAYHSKDPPNNQLMKHEERGSKSIVLMDGSKKFEIPEYTKKITFSAKKFKVPPGTTYRCFLHQLKNVKGQYYLIGNNPLIQPENKAYVHHILVHLCDKTYENEHKFNDFLCYEDDARTDVILHCFVYLLAAWAVGADGYIYPEGIANPLDENINNRWIVMEVHYNNPGNVPGIIDNSGFEIFLTDKKPKIEGGQLPIGYSEFLWTLLIPPNQKEFSSYSLCSQNCFKSVPNFPKEGIKIFAYMLHSHLAGRKIRIRVIRDGKELEPVLKDDNYDFNYQVNRSPREYFTVLKDDTVILECVYGTEDRTNFTLSGMATHNEMCLGYIYYYPKIDLLFCGSTPTYESLLKSLNLKIKTDLTAFSVIAGLSSVNEGDKLREQVEKKMNVKKWKSPSGVAKLKEIYQKVDYHEVCFVSSSAIPKLTIEKLPKFEAYTMPPDTCSK